MEAERIRYQQEEEQRRQAEIERAREEERRKLEEIAKAREEERKKAEEALKAAAMETPEPEVPFSSMMQRTAMIFRSHSRRQLRCGIRLLLHRMNWSRRKWH